MNSFKLALLIGLGLLGLSLVSAIVATITVNSFLSLWFGAVGIVSGFGSALVLGSAISDVIN